MCGRGHACRWHLNPDLYSLCSMYKVQDRIVQGRYKSRVEGENKVRIEGSEAEGRIVQGRYKSRVEGENKVRIEGSEAEGRGSGD
jgi:hypothetical protein